MKKKLSKIAEYRRLIGLTQTQLAKLIGVSHQTINNWESGKTEPLDANIGKLASVLNVSAEKLYEEMAQESTNLKLKQMNSSLIKLYDSYDNYKAHLTTAMITVNYSDPYSLIAIRMQESAHGIGLPKGTIIVVRTRGLVSSSMAAMISVNNSEPKIAFVNIENNILKLKYSNDISQEKYDLNKTKIDIIGRVIGYLGDI